MADNGEPSMEEILSSIKRIIAEDTEQAPRQRRTVGAAMPVVEPEPVAPPAQAPSPALAPEPAPDILELTDPVAEQPAAPAPSPPVEPARPHAVDAARLAEAAPLTNEALLSQQAVEASRSRLAALSALVVKPEVHGQDTLEGLVRDMLRPMLAEWLDAHLPDVVERIVALEVQRITARH